MSDNAFSEWCILELMGHRRLGGLVTEAEVGGIPFLRIDVPSEPPVTQYYGKAAIYAMTPTTEAIAKALARGFHGPVSRYELPAAPTDDPDFQEVLTTDGNILRRCFGGWTIELNVAPPGGPPKLQVVKDDSGEAIVYRSLAQAASEADCLEPHDIPF